MSPIYQYACGKCYKVEEHLFSIVNRPDYISCPICGAAAHFQMSPSEFIVNGANAANRYSSDNNFKWIGAASKSSAK